MFVFRREWRFPVRVTVTTPEGEQQTLQLVCRTGPDITARLADPEQVEEALLDSVLDWSEVVDQHGQPVPYDRELLARLLQEPWFARPFVEAWRRAREGARGNSSAGSAGTSPVPEGTATLMT